MNAQDKFWLKMADASQGKFMEAGSIPFNFRGREFYGDYGFVTENINQNLFTLYTKHNDETGVLTQKWMDRKNDKICKFIVSYALNETGKLTVTQQKLGDNNEIVTQRMLVYKKK